MGVTKYLLGGMILQVGPSKNPLFVVVFRAMPHPTLRFLFPGPRKRTCDMSEIQADGSDLFWATTLPETNIAPEE